MTVPASPVLDSDREPADVFDMPIMCRERFPTRFRWPATKAHRSQALSNHGQTLERLKERGGLCWTEMRWALTGRRWAADTVPESLAKLECETLFPQGPSTISQPEGGER